MDGERAWRVGARSGAKAQMGEGPTVHPLSPSNRLHPHGRASGARTAARLKPGGRVCSGGQTPLGHVSLGPGHARRLGLGIEPPVTLG